MARCSICQRTIWPWQRLGFRVEAHGRRYWHARCASLAPEAMARSPTPPLEHDPLAGGVVGGRTAEAPSTGDAAADRP